MACYSPVFANLDASGGFVADPGSKRVVKSLTFSCGYCIGCRIRRSQEWAIRCVHEASLHKHNSFITLTYNDKNLPVDRSVDVTHFQKFMKRLRKQASVPIRFFHCGEYGDKLGRPHYHACLFGYDFSDRKLFKIKDDISLYTSEILKDLWQFGFSTVGDVTYQSAAYVSRYIMKKITGKKSAEHYEYIDENGEIFNRKPEYITMSRRPGIASAWFDKYYSDVFPNDYVVVNKKPRFPPKYYSKLLEKHYPEIYEDVEINRANSVSQERLDNSTLERLLIREERMRLTLKLLPRTLEGSTEDNKND